MALTDIALALVAAGTGAGTQPPAAQPGGFDFITIAFLALAGVLVFFTFRSSRRRQQQAAQLQDTILPGAEVMTGSGIFGTVVEIDPIDDVKVRIETSPGTVLTVHRQAIAKVVTAEEAVDESGDADDQR